MKGIVIHCAGAALHSLRTNIPYKLWEDAIMLRPEQHEQSHPCVLSIPGKEWVQHTWSQSNGYCQCSE